jgi:hypothetical protein
LAGGRGALAALITVQVIFWTKTQPANSFWLEETELSRAATRFFQTREGSAPQDWVTARDQWRARTYFARWPHLLASSC